MTFNDVKLELIDYSNKVLNGEIVACQAHKLACKRFLNDIDREGTDEFPYVFNSQKAYKFFKWTTLFKHSKGILAGQKIEILPIQRFVFGNLYGWEHKDTAIRRFNKMYWQVGRKNAKSQSLALVGSYEAFAFGESHNEIYVGATKKDQSKIVFNEILYQLKSASYLKDKWSFSYGKITHKKSSSVIIPLSKDAGKTGDGLNVGLGILDEYHSHPTSEIYDVLVSGSGARKQPLMAIITTAGYNLNFPCYSVEYKYCKQILNTDSPIENEHYFVMINELDVNDNIQNSENWEKANPILCSYENGRKYLESELKIALDVKEKMRNFMTKNMNIWIDDKEQVLIPLATWRKNVAKFPNLTGKECYVGIDLSKKIDLTAVSWIFPVDDKFYVRSHGFLPKETLAEKRHSDRVPYDLWIEQGHLTATEGDIIDYRYIQAYIQQTANDNGWIIKEICFDPWSATQFALEMETEGFQVVEVPQNLKRMSESTKEFRDKSFQGLILHEDNPLLNWCVGNAVAKIDGQENIMLDKSKSSNRIDLLVSTVIAFTRARSASLEDAKTNILNNYLSGKDFTF